VIIDFSGLSVYGRIHVVHKSINVLAVTPVNFIRILKKVISLGFLIDLEPQYFVAKIKQTDGIRLRRKKQRSGTYRERYDNDNAWIYREYNGSGKDLTPYFSP